MFGIGDWGGNAAIFEAALAGDEAKVRELLRDKVELVHFRANKNTLKKMPQLEEGMVPLHMAARGGHRGIVELLMALKADIKCQSGPCTTPLHMATEGGHKEIAELLIDRGANVNSPDARGRTPLHLAAGTGRPELVEYLVAQRASVNAKDQEGLTAMHAAAKVGDRASVMLLRAKGGNVNERDERGRTPLHWALVPATHGVSGRYSPEQQSARENIRAVVKLLLSLGADVNAVDQSNETALDMLAGMQGDAVGIALTELLRANGGEWVRNRARFAQAAPPPPPADARMGSQAGMTVVGTAHHPQAPPADAGSPIILGKGPLTIGRDYECDVRFDSLTVSRKHSKIERGRDGFLIEDLASRNGTVVNGTRIREATLLRAADMISIGEYDFRFDGARLVPMKAKAAKAGAPA